MGKILKVDFPEDVIDRYGLEGRDVIDFEELHRSWAAEEAGEAIRACREAACSAGLTLGDFRPDDSKPSG